MSDGIGPQSVSSSKVSPNSAAMGDSVPAPLAETLVYPTVDLGLAQRLERAEALANAAYVETRRELNPHVGAGWIQVAGAHALFDGISFPLTQTFGAGIFDPVGDFELAKVEKFFTERGATTCHEVSSFATPTTWNLLSARGFARQAYLAIELVRVR